MKIGILVEVEEGLDWDRWRDTYRAAERLGFESVWLSDHLQSPWFRGRRGLETWTALAVAAAETERIIIGPLVSPITFREPTILARMAESIDGLTPGRLVIGLGLGWNDEEHASAGIAFPRVAERSRMLENGIRRIRQELGKKRINILVGGRGPKTTLPIVARCADEWNVTTASAEQYATATSQLDRMCAEVGRNPREILRSAAMGFLIGRNNSELQQHLERMRQVVPPLQQMADADRMGWLVGLPEKIVEHLKGLEKVGVERAILGHYDVADLSALELIAAEVMPAVA
jgi:alkanesulfonate monooxygenase SsuD/methylene tetrahydromethanopterin reductase-like flavin-dependent oxidoreductase (luciferase family)